jgi:hypothetical protein
MKVMNFLGFYELALRPYNPGHREYIRDKINGCVGRNVKNEFINLKIFYYSLCSYKGCPRIVYILIVARHIQI